MADLPDFLKRVRCRSWSEYLQPRDEPIGVALERRLNWALRSHFDARHRTEALWLLEHEVEIRNAAEAEEAAEATKTPVTPGQAQHNGPITRLEDLTAPPAVERDPKPGLLDGLRRAWDAMRKG